MTPEREAEIRAVLNGDQSVGLDDALPVVSKAADDLIAEVDRLRAGIAEAQHVEHLGSDCAACDMRGVLHALLNPPTEGETDE